MDGGEEDGGVDGAEGGETGCGRVWMGAWMKDGGGARLDERRRERDWVWSGVDGGEDGT